VHTKGNDACHVILRGDNKGPNYSSKNVQSICQELEGAKLLPKVMIDCSHGNSQKDHRNQPKVAEDVCSQISQGNKEIMGLMIESHLFEGNQKAGPLETLDYGISITDACIGWDDTVPLLNKLAQSVQARRKRQN